MQGQAAPGGQTTTTQQKDYSIMKVMLAGYEGCGKSNIMNRYVDDTFTEQYIATIGVDFKTKTIQSNGKLIKLQIWDTAGQQRFKAITSSYYKGAMIFFLVYDCQNVESFKRVHDGQKTFETYGPQKCSKWLVANKSNEGDMKISTEQGMERAKEIGFQFMEVSAKSGYNLSQLFEVAVDHTIKNNLI